MPLLDTPQILQRSDHDCGAAAFKTLFRYHYPRKPLPDWGELADPERGIQPDTLELFARKEFPDCHFRAKLDLRALRFHTEQTPVMCLITITPTLDHWVCVRGVTPHRVHVQCPTSGRLSYSHEEWLLRWRDATSGGIYTRIAITGWPA